MQNMLRLARFRAALKTGSLLLLLLLGACSDPITIVSISELKSPENLRVGFVPTPGLFFPDSELDSGMDFEIVLRFADTQGRNLIPVQVKNNEELLDYLKQDKIDIALPGSGFSTKDKNILFSKSYRISNWHLIYNQKHNRPKQLQKTDNIFVIKNSNADNILKELKTNNNAIHWQYAQETTTVELLKQIEHNKLKYTILDNDSFSYYRRLFPELKYSTALEEKQTNHWLCIDKALLKEIDAFLAKKQTIALIKSTERHYQKHLRTHDYFEKLYFLERIQTRLGQYIPFFKKASDISKIDWRLLAAISYQESHWDKDARSFTGVEGLMMLTQATAKQMGVKDRVDPKQSIIGGAKYLNVVDKQIPELVQLPDRLWFTLAAYNVGYGHLEDARKLTQQNQRNPNDWTQVRKYLQKLSIPEWYTQTRYGYARGSEPVYYVEHVRRYYISLKLYLYYRHLLQTH